MPLSTLALLLLGVGLLVLPATLTLLKQVRDASYARMQARLIEAERALAECEKASAVIGKQHGGMKVRYSILESERDGVVQIARTLTAQLVGANIKPAQDVESFLRFQNNSKEVQHGDE